MPLVNERTVQMQGYSVNAVKKIGEESIVEKWMALTQNRHPYFDLSNGISTGNHFITTSIAIDLMGN